MSQFYSELINEGDKFTIWVYKSNFYLKNVTCSYKKEKGSYYALPLYLWLYYLINVYNAI